MKFGPNASKSGIALVLVIGLIVIMMPVIFMFSRMGSSQQRQASYYHENLLAESVALSATSAGISRLQGNKRGYQSFPDELIGEQTYSLNIRPTGEGFFKQRLYYLMASSNISRRNYTIMADVEQFRPEPKPPVSVIARNYWNSLEPYEINLMADVLAMQNTRGVELIRLLETRRLERHSTEDDYRQLLNNKLALLPAEVAQDWSEIVSALVLDKLELDL